MRRNALPTALLLGLTTAGVAQPSYTQTYTVTRTASGLQLVPPSGLVEDVSVDPQSGAELVFNCQQSGGPPVDCTRATASLVNLSAGTTDPLLPANPTTAQARIIVPAGKSGSLTLRIGNDPVGPALQLVSARDVGPTSVEVVRRSEIVCAELAGLRGDYRRNEATFVVATDGFVIARPHLPVDENDVVRVHVVGDPDVLRTVKIERTSPIRGVGQARFVGEDVIGTIRRQALTQSCGVASSPVTDFAHGEGVVTITTRNQQRQPVAERFSFRVNPLYNGAFSFGPVLSRLDDREFGVLADSTITETEVGEHHGEYLLSYTHFIFGPRDIEKAAGPYVNPMIGISLEDPLESVFLGASIDFSHGGFFLVIGAHGGQVTRLSPASGFEVGDKLPKEFGSVPTREEWDWNLFYGVTVDLRAAVKLFGTVLTGGQS